MALAFRDFLHSLHFLALISIILLIKYVFYCLRRCPWTGTAIGKKNMFAFQCFVTLVFTCLVFDIVLLTGGAIK